MKKIIIVTLFVLISSTMLAQSMKIWKGGVYQEINTADVDSITFVENINSGNSSITPQNHDYTIGEDKLPEGVSASAPTGSLNEYELKLVGTWTVAGTNSSKAPSPVVLGANRVASDATGSGTWGADSIAICLYSTYNQEHHLRIITYTIVDSKTVDFYKTRYVTQDGNTGM